MVVMAKAQYPKLQGAVINAQLRQIKQTSVYQILNTPSHEKLYFKGHRNVDVCHIE